MQDPRFTEELAALKLRLAGIFAAAVICILAGGLAYHHHYQKAIRRDASELLESIKRFKTDQILFWRADRFNDTNSLLDTPVLSTFLNQLAASPGDKDLLARMHSRFESYLKHNDYRSAVLVWPDGRVLTGVGTGGNKPLPPEAVALIKKAESSGRTELGDFYVGPTGRPRMDIASKAASAPGNRRLYLVLEIAPDDYLYPLLQTWPTNTRSGETVLARKEGREVLFLGDLRYTADAGMKLRLPFSDSRLPVVRALNGESGIVAGKDYRGVRVLASIGLIPGTNWGIVVKMDWDEIMAESGRLSALVLIFTFILVASAGGWSYLLFKLHAERYSKTLEQAETEKESYKFNLKTLTEQANDMILLADPAARTLILVNKKTCETYGYTEEEMLKLKPENLIPPEFMDKFNGRFKGIASGEHALYDTVHMRKNGERFPIEVSAVGVRQGGKDLVYFICRDITGRKRLETELREKEERYRTLFENNPMPMLIYERGSLKMLAVNEVFLKNYGYTREEALALRLDDLYPDEEKGPIVELAARLHGLATAGEWHHRRKDGSLITIIAHSHDLSYMGRDARVAVMTDITELKRAEELIHENETIFSSFLEHSPAYIFFKDKDIRALRLSRNYEKLLGLPLEKALGKTMDELFPSELSKAMVRDDLRVLNEGKVVVAEEMLDGRYYETTKFPIFKGGSPHMLAGFTLDVTDRKKAELELERAGEELRRTQQGLLKNLRLYTILAQINQAAAQTKDLKKLYSSICEIAVKTGGFRMAWVGSPDRDTGRVLPVCSAGNAGDYLARIKIETRDGSAAKGPTGWAARTGGVMACQDIETDPYMQPWRDKALQLGYRSSAALPLYDGQQLTAILNVYSSEKGFFTDEEIKLLTEIKDDISLAIEAISSEAKRGSAQSALERTAAQLTHMMDAMPVVLYTLRMVNGKLIPQWVSGNSQSITGHDPAEMLAPDWFERNIHPDDKSLTMAEMAQTLKKGQLAHDFRLARKDGGGYVWVHSQLRAGPEGSGEINGSWTDITPLKESEMRFKKLFEKTPLAARPPEQAGRDEIYLVDPATGRINYASFGALKNLGYTRAEIEAKHCWDVAVELGGESFAAFMAPLVKKQKKLLIIETEHKRKDGTVYQVQSRVQLLEASSGPILLVVATELLGGGADGSAREKHSGR